KHSLGHLLPVLDDIGQTSRCCGQPERFQPDPFYWVKQSREDKVMTQVHQSRRALLTAAVAVSTFGSVSVGSSVRAVAAEVNGASRLRAVIDAVLQRAVDSKEVPGVVAMAATDQGIFYEGTVGVRNLATGPSMNPDTVFRIASMTKAVTSV